MWLFALVVVLYSLSHVWLLWLPCTVSRQAPLSMGFSKQEYWRGLPFPSPGSLPDPGIEPWSPALQAVSLPTELPRKPYLLWDDGNSVLLNNFFFYLIIAQVLTMWLRQPPKQDAHTKQFQEPDRQCKRAKPMVHKAVEISGSCHRLETVKEFKSEILKHDTGQTKHFCGSDLVKMSPVSGLKADWSSELENQANYRCPGWALLSYICLAPWRVKNYYYFKTSMRYHPTPVRTAIIKKSTNDKRCRRCGGKWTHVNGWWNCKLTPPRWKTVWRFLLKNENRTTIWPSNSTPMYMNRKKKKY